MTVGVQPGHAVHVPTLSHFSTVVITQNGGCLPAHQPLDPQIAQSVWPRTMPPRSKGHTPL